MDKPFLIAHQMTVTKIAGVTLEHPQSLEPGWYRVRFDDGKPVIEKADPPLSQRAVDKAGG